MGQAKRRGTFEERKALAVERNNRKREHLDRMYEIRGRNKTPEQRTLQSTLAAELAALFGVAATVSDPFRRVRR